MSSNVSDYELFYNDWDCEIQTVLGVCGYWGYDGGGGGDYPHSPPVGFVVSDRLARLVFRHLKISIQAYCVL